MEADQTLTVSSLSAEASIAPSGLKETSKMPPPPGLRMCQGTKAGPDSAVAVAAGGGALVSLGLRPPLPPPLSEGAGVTLSGAVLPPSVALPPSEAELALAGAVSGGRTRVVVDGLAASTASCHYCCALVNQPC